MKLLLRKAVLPSHLSDMEPETQGAAMQYLKELTARGKTHGGLPNPIQLKHDITSIYTPNGPFFTQDQDASTGPEYEGTDQKNVPHIKVLEGAQQRGRGKYAKLVGTNSRSRYDKYATEGPLQTARSRELAWPATTDEWERNITGRKLNMPRRAYSSADKDDPESQGELMQQFARMALLSGMPEDTPIIYGAHDPRIADKRAFKLHEIATGKHIGTPYGTTTFKSLSLVNEDDPEEPPDGSAAWFHRTLKGDLARMRSQQPVAKALFVRIRPDLRKAEVLADAGDVSDTDDSSDDQGPKHNTHQTKKKKKRKLYLSR